MNVSKVIPLLLGLGDLTVKIWFMIVRGLAVKVLLVTSLIDKFMKSIFRMRQVV